MKHSSQIYIHDNLIFHILAV